MTALITEAELTKRLRLEDATKVAKMRRRKKWPHVRVSRFDIRYTEAQVEQIIASLEVGQGPTPHTAGTFGQTTQSARRSR